MYAYIAFRAEIQASHINIYPRYVCAILMTCISVYCIAFDHTHAQQALNIETVGNAAIGLAS